MTAAERGHEVTLFEAAAGIGGQLNLARTVPGKEEFDETLRYFRARMAEPRHCLASQLEPGRSDARQPQF